MTDILGGVQIGAEASSIVTADELLVELGVSAPTAQETIFAGASVKKSASDVKLHLHYDPVFQRRTEYYPLLAPTIGQKTGVWEVNSTQAYLRNRATATTEELQLLHLPIRASEAADLRIDYDGRFGTRVGSFADATIQEEGNDFWFNYDGLDEEGARVCRDGIVRSYGLWPEEPGSIQVTYTSGYTENEFRGLSALMDASGIYNVVMEEALRRFKKSYGLWLKNSKLGHVVGNLRSERLGSYSYMMLAQGADTILASTALTAESRERLASFRHYGTYFV